MMAFPILTPPSVACMTCGSIADSITPTGPNGDLHCTCMACGQSWVVEGGE